jgi:hypothetical protein
LPCARTLIRRTTAEIGLKFPASSPVFLEIEEKAKKGQERERQRDRERQREQKIREEKKGI